MTPFGSRYGGMGGGYGSGMGMGMGMGPMGGPPGELLVLIYVVCLLNAFVNLRHAVFPFLHGFFTIYCQHILSRASCRHLMR